MDKRKDSLSTLKICRFCLTQDGPMLSLYDNKKRNLKNSVDLPLKILSCVSIEVFPSDKMPVFICQRCKYFMNLCYDFKQICRQADEKILHFVQDNKPLKPVSWAVSLNDAYRALNEIRVMKTVVEDGTTVQVTHGVSDSEDEEEDENVYNVKINDGSDEESKKCVKVVTSRENTDNRNTKQLSKGDADKCWACNECECTYPLQQMLELHKLRKHRQRNVQCDVCDDKFFSKYDLAIHQLRHSNDMSFECAACGKKFKRLIQLKRHEKLIHADLTQLACGQCPASFISPDELEAHRKKHLEPVRPYTCEYCDKKFLIKPTMHRHIQYMHNRLSEFACEYCPQRFTSVTKLSKHVRTHAGERPYPCKYCDKSFTKSHHYTRHVRLKHRESERARSSSVSEQFRCEQCVVTFTNQDELIYHSAIHATQNLTCPLCQEKFENVDAVTTHIKSHVNGVEFMCDFCELVFTSKEKLDTHLMLAHEDEIQNELGLDEMSMEAEEADMEVDPEAEAEGEEDDDDNSINVKEEDDHMVVEIKKADEFMLKNQQSTPEQKPDENSNSEESETESTQSFTQMTTLNKVNQVQVATKTVVDTPSERAVLKSKQPAKPVTIVRKTEEVKHSPIHQVTDNSAAKKEKSRVETASDKSLRLLEKELQDLKRTNSRTEAVKTAVKSVEISKSRGRPPLHTSTPKLKPVEEKKIPAVKTPIIEKKPMEKKPITKENKEPKESKEVKVKDIKDMKEDKSTIKNGTSDKNTTDDGVRRSTRPSKIKDYAKMIRDNSRTDSDSDDQNDEEYVQTDKNTEVQRLKARRSSVWNPQRSSPAPATPGAPLATPTPPRKRGRPRKEPPVFTKETPAKIKKMEAERDSEPESEEKFQDTSEVPVETKQLDESQNNTVIKPGPTETTDTKSEVKEGSNDNNNSVDPSKCPAEEQDTSTNDSKMVSPTGQPLKKVQIKYLPPGVKPLPLPLVNRNMSSGELCEMQIGKKVVKVQKIVMTKAEVEAMAKKGLVEMKGGTMVLKQGIKLPKADSVTIKAVNTDGGKESPNKKEKALPTRCDFGDD